MRKKDATRKEIVLAPVHRMLVVVLWVFVLDMFGERMPVRPLRPFI
jgi:hypothetical protein